MSEINIVACLVKEPLQEGHRRFNVGDVIKITKQRALSLGDVVQIIRDFGVVETNNGETLIVKKVNTRRK